MEISFEVRLSLTRDAPELIKKSIKFLTEKFNFDNGGDSPYDMYDHTVAINNFKCQLLRYFQILNGCHDIVKNTKNLDTAKYRMEYFHQTLHSIQPLFILFGDADYSEVTNILERFKIEAHSAFYINYYLANIEKMAKVKRQPTKDKYFKIAIESLKTGLNDEFADHRLIGEYLSKHNSDVRIQGIQSGEGIIININDSIEEKNSTEFINTYEKTKDRILTVKKIKEKEYPEPKYADFPKIYERQQAMFAGYPVSLWVLCIVITAMILSVFVAIF